MEEVKELMLRLPLRYHIRAYESLAKSREPEAIGELEATIFEPVSQGERGPTVVFVVSGDESLIVGVRACRPLV